MGQQETALAVQKLVDLAAECGLSFDDLLELWSADTAKQLAQASAALAAGDMREAARLVHSASGASGLCGVTALAEQLKMVELLAVEGRCRDAQQALASARLRFAGINVALHGGAQS
jgi:HPt (histidine-containing phosphotransfer) domain-containing protein